MSVRAEHSSLQEYLEATLIPEQRARPLLISFTQWDFAVAAVAEVAMTLHAMGSTPSIALWSAMTPLRDVGWQSHHAIAGIFRSPTIDMRVKQALAAAGLPASCFVEPQPWKGPSEALPVIDATYRTALRKLTYRGAPMGRGILQVPPTADVPVTDDYSWPRRYVHKAALSYAYVFDQTMAAIERTGATAVFAYNGRFLHDSAVAAAAEQRGLPVLSYDTGGLDTDFDLTIDATHDWSALQDRMKTMVASWPRDEAHTVGGSWFTDRRNHAEEANRHFTGAQKIGRGIERSPDEVVVTYFSSSGDEIAELDLDWSDFFDGQPGALLAVAEACRELGYRLVVRTHPHKRFKPKEDVRDWHQAVEAAGPDLHLDEHSDVDSYTLMDQSDVVVTYGSTTGVEAGFAGRPVIVMGPSAYDELGCAVRVRTVEELMQAIIDQKPPLPDFALPYGLMMKRRGFTYQHVNHAPDGSRQLAGKPIVEPRPMVRHLSHALNQRTRSALMRD